MEGTHNVALHEFFVDQGFVHLDDDGEPMIGHYWQLVDTNQEPITELAGPYSSQDEALEACQKALDDGDV